MGNSFKTFLKHTAKDFHNQSVNPPVVRASTIIFKSMKDIRKTQAKAIKNPTGGHYDYGRQGTSTTYILQKILTKLEESYHVFTTPTGFGAVFLAIFSVTRPGDEIIAVNGHRIRSSSDLSAAVYGCIDVETTFTISREGAIKEVAITPIENPKHLVNLEGKGNKLWDAIKATKR